MSAASVLLGGAALLLAVGLGAAVLLLRRERLAHDATRARAARLEADLDAALRPPSPATGVERAVRRVVRTAAQLRREGVGGLLQSSLDDLQTWATDGRSQVATMAAADGTVTLFFSDIEGSTRLNARLGDDAFVKVLAAHDALVRSRVEKHRGQVVKTAGDGFMVAFRDAEAACRAALSIQRRLASGRDHRLRRERVAVRIGIHTGTAVSRDGDYFGRNVATAARLADLADGGQVLASRAVAAALDEDAVIVLEPRGETELRGLPGTHEVYLVEPRPGTPP
ncbi:adenylate/guanylate cyclase domain-containing protein [Nocardioides sp. AX2bis]|uniref:adenylate/guanylate cyclase domain-containing protein n=1 Tax=Nocardioides sp. AX2bis TaxID=2653157 RepID=UPI0012F04F16|nr:adenylate/guanylate cyclase domain-containing protein [Nocardioides sp. AX2bis]VXC06203.1 Adenylate cyclase, class 3 [Nocardioides sp. AX2bis]